MLSLHQQEDRLKRADNLLPTVKGTMRSRPGVIQLISGDITNAQPWGDKALLEKQGRLSIWDGSENDILSSGYQLQASSFQAYSQDARREDRLYVADGTRPLWYVKKLADGSYQVTTVSNSVTDSNGIPYPLPIPKTIATWRNRLFIGDGTNRIQHCQNQKPEEFDPLWSLEFQTDAPDSVQLLKENGENLFVGLSNSCFAVTGTSHLNWQRPRVSGANGVTGPDSITTNGASIYWVSRKGVESNNANFSNSDIENLFSSNVSNSHIEIDNRRKLLFVLISNRLFVMHLERPGYFGEISGYNIRGLIAFDDYVAWYGANGLWTFGSENEPDRLLDGTSNDFISIYETWENIPNVKDKSRFDRLFVKVKGSTRGNATYSLSRDGVNAFNKTFTLADQDIDTGLEVAAGADGEYQATRPVTREITPHEVGESFKHKISASCHMEIINFEPIYTFN